MRWRSVAEETAFSTSGEAVVGLFGVGVVRDHAVIARLLHLVCNDRGACVRAARLSCLLGLRHALLSLVHVRLVLFSLVLLLELAASHGDESLALLGRSWFRI